MTSPIRKNETKYTPAMRQQMLEAILKYRRENDIKWEIFHYRIKAAIGLDDNDTRLHSSDPRHWVNGRVPNEGKLDLYANFIKKVYPDFEFSDSRIRNYISIGESLSRFSVRESILSETKLKKQAKSLHRKFFHSEVYMLAYKFNYQYRARGGSTNDHPDKCDILLQVGNIEIVGIHKGVISPFSDGSGYHGILNTSDNKPNHITIKKHPNPEGFARGFEYNGVGGTWWGSTTVPFRACDYMAELDQAVSDMGEPEL
jgi:hypothetical protein